MKLYQMYVCVFACVCVSKTNIQLVLRNTFCCVYHLNGLRHNVLVITFETKIVIIWNLSYWFSELLVPLLSLF